jgi:hypothetical protein
MFNETNKNVIPPLGILLFIYGKISFFSWDDDKKKSSILFKDILNSLDKSFNKIITRQTQNPSPVGQKFIQDFSSEFPSPFFNNIIQHGGENKPTNSDIPRVNRSAYTGRPSNIGYYITITLYLFPGKDVPPEKLNAAMCQIKKDNVNKSWAELRNTRYSPQAIQQK